MTTTARTMTRRIATDSAAIAALVINGIFEDFATCELCALPSAELFERTDNRDDSVVQVCESCADNADVSCSDHIDA